jgi:hypothetical protein
MRRLNAPALVLLALMLASCDSGKEADSQPPAEPKARVATFADPLIGTQEKARQRTEDAVETHRQALDQQMRAAEGETPEQ